MVLSFDSAELISEGQEKQNQREGFCRGMFLYFW